MNLLEGEIKKILIIRYRFVGDTVLSIPFIKNVRENFPNAQIDVLVSPNSGELIEGNPDVTNVIYLDTTRFHKYEKQGSKEIKEQGNKYTSFFSCAMALRKENYNIAFVLKRSFSSAFLAFLTRAKYRVGFNTELRSFLLTHLVKHDKNIHELDNFLNCLRVIDIKPTRYNPEIYPLREEEIRANGFLVRLDRSKPKVLIHPISAHPYKRWPSRYCAKLIDRLYEESGAQFVFTGAKLDKEVYNNVIKWCKNKNRFKVLDLCGLTNLRECFAIYRGLDLAICVDSGNAHLIAGAGVPTYVLYGPTSPERWLPIGKNVFPVRLSQLLPCQPCEVKVKCSHLSCMKLLTPEIVFRDALIPIS